jgi:hypothetical protein
MRCPICGYEEKAVSICSQCHASLPVKIEKPVTPPPSVPIRPKPPMPLLTEEPPKEKFRRRPLMDLDLTIPELETEDEIQAKLKESILIDKKAKN